MDRGSLGEPAGMPTVPGVLEKLCGGWHVSQGVRLLCVWLVAAGLGLSAVRSAELISDSVGSGGGFATGGGVVLNDSFESAVGIGDQTGAGVLVRSGWLGSVNNAPRFAVPRGVVAGRVDQPVVVTYQDLATRSGVTDVDGDPVVFRLTAAVGRFEKNGQSSLETTLASGETVRWVPGSQVSGVETIVKAQATDGLLGAVGEFLLGVTDGTILPPIITKQPEGGTFKLGSSVSFALGLSGTPPFKFQWRLDGKPVEGATSETLNLPDLARSQAGVYSVVVENSAGSDTSKGAEIVVYVPPKFELPRVQPPSSGGGGTGGGFLLRFGGADGGPPGTSNGSGGTPTYVVQWSTDLVRWNDLPPEAFVLRDGKYELIDRGDLSVFRFYRIVER